MDGFQQRRPPLRTALLLADFSRAYDSLEEGTPRQDGTQRLAHMLHQVGPWLLERLKGGSLMARINQQQTNLF